MRRMTELDVSALVCRAVEAAVLAEREACAKIAEEWPIPVWCNGNEANMCVGIAEKIRERPRP